MKDDADALHLLEFLLIRILVYLEYVLRISRPTIERTYNHSYIKSWQDLEILEPKFVNSFKKYYLRLFYRTFLDMTMIRLGMKISVCVDLR